MFDKIRFYYDYQGDYLGEERNERSVAFLNVTLRAKDCNARCFTLCDTTVRSNHGDVPGIMVSRRLGPLAKDPYNEDGRPPDLMFTMVCHHIEHCDGMITIEGFERPNLSWAGVLRPPYAHNYKPPRGVKYMSEELSDIIHDQTYETLRRQKIVLEIMKGWQ